jgi:hypothetical protein
MTLSHLKQRLSQQTSRVAYVDSQQNMGDTVIDGLFTVRLQKIEAQRVK